MYEGTKLAGHRDRWDCQHNVPIREPVRHEDPESAELKGRYSQVEPDRPGDAYDRDGADKAARRPTLSRHLVRGFAA